MKRLLPRTIGAQLITVALIAMVLSQTALITVMVVERQTVARGWWTAYIMSRLAATVELLEASPEHLYPQILQASTTPRLSFAINPDNTVEGNTAEDELYAGELRTMVGKEPQDIVVSVSVPPTLMEIMQGWIAEWLDRPLYGNNIWVQASVKLKNGQWLYLEVGHRLHAPPAAVIFAPVFTMLAMFGAAVVMVIRRITLPLKRLATAAEALGRGEEVEPVPVSGPAETRQAIQAFNEMRERLSRFVLDRTRMLAAVGHDLRTPITNLRLRAEFIEDDETRVRILASLDEMQHLAEAALAFARQEATSEVTRMVDINALVQSVCADQADMDRDVTFTEDGRLPIRCRPNSLKRALHNLIENAIYYGKRARVHLTAQGKELAITVEDDGPGIPEADMARAFSPFVRLDEARGQETGGIGLGLAIARSIVRGHGGDIRLRNRPEGGLSATILLPRDG